MGIEDIHFWKTLNILIFFGFSLYPWKFHIIQSSTPGNFVKLYMLHPSEISFKAKSQDPLKFHMTSWKFHILTPGNSACYFLNTPGNSMSSITLPLGFFQTSPISKALYWIKHCPIRMKITYHQLLVGFFHKLISLNARDVGHNMLHLHVAWPICHHSKVHAPVNYLLVTNDNWCWAEQKISIWYWSKQNIARFTQVKNGEAEKPDIQLHNRHN